MGNIPGRQNKAGKDPMGDEEGAENGTSREGGRGYSQDSLDNGGAVKDNPAGYSFFGDPIGKNEDCQNRPEVKGPSKPTL